ncbi:MAG: ABC transporter substrate-binding protein [Candidatus Bipolaricaulia bacterium]
MRRKLAGVSLLLLALVVVSVVGFGALKGTRTIVWAYQRDIANLDPSYIPGSPNYQVAMNIFDGLVRYQAHVIDVEPSLAKSFELSEDGLVYTFHLVENAVFHKGYGPVTSEDVKFSFDRIMDKTQASRYYGSVQNIAEVVAVDQYTVQIRLKSPQPSFLVSVVAFRPGYIVSKKAVEEKGKAFATDPIGSGPYVFQSWSPGNEMVMVANEEYWNGAPYFKKVTLKVIPEESVAAMALINDEVNFFQIYSAETVLSLQGAPRIEFNSVAGTWIHPVWLNTTRPPLDKVEVRRAIAHAIDKAALAEAVTFGVGLPVESVIPPPMIGFTPDVATYPYDPALARRMLADAGYPNGFDLELTGRSDPDQVKISTVLQEQLAQVGITLKVTLLETGAYSEKMKTCDTDLNIESIARFEPDQMVTEFLYSGSFPPGGNRSRYTAVDELAEKQTVENDRAERERLLALIQQQVAVDVPGIMLYVLRQVSAYQDYIKGVVDNHGNWMTRFDLMYAEE